MAGHPQLSVYFILPETKGVSLERMENIFGGTDYVEAGEAQASLKLEDRAYSNGDQKTLTNHVENTSTDPSPQRVK